MILISTDALNLLAAKRVHKHMFIGARNKKTRDTNLMKTHTISLRKVYLRHTSTSGVELKSMEKEVGDVAQTHRKKKLCAAYRIIGK